MEPQDLQGLQNDEHAREKEAHETTFLQAPLQAGLCLIQIVERNGSRRGLALIANASWWRCISCRLFSSWRDYERLQSDHVNGERAKRERVQLLQLQGCQCQSIFNQLFEQVAREQSPISITRNQKSRQPNVLRTKVPIWLGTKAQRACSNRKFTSIKCRDLGSLEAGPYHELSRRGCPLPRRQSHDQERQREHLGLLKRLQLSQFNEAHQSTTVPCWRRRSQKHAPRQQW